MFSFRIEQRGDSSIELYIPLEHLYTDINAKYIKMNIKMRAETALMIIEFDIYIMSSAKRRCQIALLLASS